jgi:hypothetical protein
VRRVRSLPRYKGHGMIERIRPLLTRYPEDEEFARELEEDDASFDALCEQYRRVIELLNAFDIQIKQLREFRAWLEEKLLARIEGQPSQ